MNTISFIYAFSQPCLVKFLTFYLFKIHHILTSASGYSFYLSGKWVQNTFNEGFNANIIIRIDNMKLGIHVDQSNKNLLFTKKTYQYHKALTVSFVVIGYKPSTSKFASSWIIVFYNEKYFSPITSIYMLL